MADKSALVLAQELALRRRDALALGVAQRQAQRQAAVQQLTQLQTYVAETETKWVHRGAATGADVMHHHYQFLAKLDHAIAYQQRVIQTHEHQIKQAQAALVEAEHRLKQFQHVIAARSREQAQLQERREQKQNDELAALMAGRQARRVQSAREARHADTVAAYDSFRD